MKLTYKSAVASLALAIITPLMFSSCETTPKKASGGTHNMGGPASGQIMANDAMPGAR